MPAQQRRVLGAGLALMLGLFGAVAIAEPASAATIQVTNASSDVGATGSLAWAIETANTNAGADVIIFDMSSVPAVLALTIALPDLDGDVEIRGPGSAALTITQSDPTALAVFQGAPAAPITVGISGLTLRSTVSGLSGIDVTDVDLVVSDLDASDFDNAGVLVTDGALDIGDSVLTGNSGGLVFTGSAGDNLTIASIDVSGNGSGMAYGVYAGVEDAVTTVTDVRADDAITWGVYLELSGGSATISGVRSDGTGVAGLAVGAFGAAATVSDVLVTGSSTAGVQLGATGTGATLDASGIRSQNNDGAGLYLIADDGGVLTVSDAAASDNADTGAMILATAGGRVELTRASLRGNGFDPCGCGGSGAALTADDASILIADSSIADNQGEYAGGLDVEVSSGASVSVVGSTIAENEALENGGGIAASGDDTGHVPPSTVDILNSTISGNMASGAGGGIWLTEGPVELAVRHSTVANNRASLGDGVYLRDAGTALRLDHALLGDNGTDLLLDSDAVGFTARYSLVESTLATLPDGAGNIVGIDPRLGPLADNGGPTRTHMLLDGSPAFNTGDAAFAPPPALDQRGEPRVFQVIDIGAVEKRIALPPTGAVPPSPLIAGLLALIGLALFAIARLRAKRR